MSKAREGLTRMPRRLMILNVQTRKTTDRAWNQARGVLCELGLHEPANVSESCSLSPTMKDLLNAISDARKKVK